MATHPPSVERRLVPLPDGRQLDVSIGGAESDQGLVFLVGLASGAVPFAPAVELAAARGLRYLGLARPGYARSTRHPDRRVADTAADIEVVARHLGLRRLIAIGWSMGGPHALALAALLPDLTGSVASIGGMAPHREDEGGYDWRAETSEEWVRRRQDGPEFAEALPEFVASLPKTPDVLREDLASFPPPDAAAALASPGYPEFMVDTFADAVSHGFWGAHDDVRSAVRPWGFAVQDIRVPTAIWHGEQDGMIPIAHSRWLAAAIPDARGHLEPDDGHLSIVIRRLDEAVDELLELADHRR
jgi:pimeloyl-ACP methyl ester carboxylesterase